MAEDNQYKEVMIRGRVFRNFRPAKNKSGRTLYVPKEMDNFLVWNLPDDYNYLDANPEIKEEVLIRVAEGETVTKASETLGIPFSIILDLSRRNEEFGGRLDEARRFRAEKYHDKLDEVAESVDHGNSRAAKVKTDIYKHLMAVGDRDRFGQQQKIVGDPNAPVSFIVDTGVRRDIAEPIPAEGKAIGEEAGEAGNDDQDLDGLPAEIPPAIHSRET